MNKLPLNHQGKEKNGFWLLNPASNIENILLSLFFLLLPTQLGKHFWPDFAVVSGIRIDYLSPTIYFTDLLLVLLFIFFLSRQNRHLKSVKFKVQSAKLLVSGFVFLFLVWNIFQSSNPLLSLYGLAKLCEFGFVVYYVAKIIKHTSQFSVIAFLFGISSLFESLLAIAQYLNQGSLNGLFYFLGERTFTGMTPGIANASVNGILLLRPYGSFPHPNVLAGYLLVSMVLVWSFLLMTNKRWMQIFGSIVLVVSSIALLLTFSRVGIFLWLLGVVGISFQLLFKKIKTVRHRFLISILTICLLAFLGALPFAHEVISRFSQTSFVEESFVERSELLSASWTMIQQNPFLGVGLNNFLPSLAPLQKPLPLGLYLQPVHNIFVLVVAETGVIGLGLFVGVLLATWQRIKNSEKEIRGTLFCLLAIILVTGLFDHYWLTLQQGQLLFAIVLGLSWSRQS